LETVLKITEGGGNKIYVEKKKRGSSTRGFCFTENSNQKEFPKATFFFLPLQQAYFLLVSITYFTGVTIPFSGISIA